MGLLAYKRTSVGWHLPNTLWRLLVHGCGDPGSALIRHFFAAPIPVPPLPTTICWPRNARVTTGLLVGWRSVTSAVVGKHRSLETSSKHPAMRRVLDRLDPTFRGDGAFCVGIEILALWAKGPPMGVNIFRKKSSADLNQIFPRPIWRMGPTSGDS
jgi:hypothetical protein